MRRAGPCRRGLPPDPDPQGLPGRSLRADGGSGGGKETRREIRGGPRGGPSGDRGHADRGKPARSPTPQLSHRLCRGARRGRPRLDRRLHRRPHGHALHPRRARADAGAARPARGAGRREPGGRAARPDRRGRRHRDAAGPGELRFHRRRCPGRRDLRREGPRRLRNLQPGRSRRAGGDRPLPRAHAEGPAAPAPAAAP